MQPNAEIANELKLISCNTDKMKKGLAYIKSLTAHVALIIGKEVSARERKSL